jgi:ABC-2 type transport system permease protein
MGGAIKAEVRKIFTTRLWWGLLIGVVVLGALLSAALAAILGDGQAAGGGGQGGNPTPLTGVAAAQAIYSAGFGFTLAQLFPLALGVLVITSEFRHKTFSATVLATPKRWKIPIAKVAAIIVVGIVYAVVYNIGAIIGGGLVLKLAKNSSLYLDSGAVWQTLALCALAFVVWTLLGFGFGMLLRNQLAAVFVSLGVTFFGTLVLGGIFLWRGWDWAHKFLASNATTSMLNPSAGGDAAAQSFSWWGSALLLIGYAAVLTAAGAFLTSRRDVT